MAKPVDITDADELDAPAEGKGVSAVDDTYMETVRERYAAAKAGWSSIYEDFRRDVRFVSGEPADQWDTLVKSSRDDDGVPALTMDRVNPLINQIVNQSRKDRPQPKVNAGDGGDPATADVIEGKMRHCLYESHADVAFDCSQMYCASGGIGFYRIKKEYTSDRGWIQEPRVARIPDPTQILFDPEVQEQDFSDARYCFAPKKYSRAEFKAIFKVEPIPFPFDADLSGHWGDEGNVTVAEYWHVEKIKHRLVQLTDGREGIAGEFEFDEADVINERELCERIVHCDIVDGSRRLEDSIWEGKWIPIIPQIAKEVISEGKKRFVSAIRYMRDPQAAINAAMSKTATAMATINEAPFIGPKGIFRDPKWRDGKRHFYLEYETNIPGMPVGTPVAPPVRNAFEPAIQGSTSFTVQSVDALKGALGYVDSVTSPSQQDLSGVAVQRRDQQQGAANMQYEDSLTQSMWHCGRVMVDLLKKLTDTPRMWQTRKEDGTQSAVPITMAVPEGTSPHAPGYEDQPHTRIDDGDYGVTISVGPSFNTKTEEGTQFLLDLVRADPALIPIYAPAIFKRLGYEDLEAIAEAAQPPQIRQALMQAQGKGPDPAMMAQQAQHLQQQNQQMQQVIQHLAQIVQTKQIETEGKLQVQNAKTQGDLAVQKLATIRALIEKATDHAHDATTQLTGHHVASIKHVLDMAHAATQQQNQQEFQAAQPQQGAPQ